MTNQATKFHPILFSTPMVQAIQEGRKYQTRRTKGLEKVNTDWRPWKFVDFCSNPENENDNRKHAIFTCFTDTWFNVPCPYELGDVLWVRETFGIGSRGSIIYKANYDDTQFNSKEWKWKPSIFMPKEACRTFLKIKSIRVHRLKEITHWDSIAEGVAVRLIDGCEEYKDYLAEGVSEDEPWGETYFPNNPKPSFLSLWESINGKESLEQNPFVWVYQFQQIEKPLDFI